MNAFQLRRLQDVRRGRTASSPSWIALRRQRDDRKGFGKRRRRRQTRRLERLTRRPQRHDRTAAHQEFETLLYAVFLDKL